MRWIYTKLFFSYLGLPVPDEMSTNQEYTVNINSGKLKLNSLKKKKMVNVLYEKSVAMQLNYIILYDFS